MIFLSEVIILAQNCAVVLFHVLRLWNYDRIEVEQNGESVNIAGPPSPPFQRSLSISYRRSSILEPGTGKIHDGWMDGRTDGRTDGRMDGRTDGRTD